MKKFKFSLEQVLIERKRIEDLRLREWSLATSILNKLKVDLVGMQERLSAAMAKQTETAGENIAVMQTIEDFIQGMKVRIEWRKNDIRRGTILTDRKHGEYIRARQKREVLEKLKTRRFDQFHHHIRVREAKAADDLNIMRNYLNHQAEREEVAA